MISICVYISNLKQYIMPITVLRKCCVFVCEKRNAIETRKNPRKTLHISQQQNQDKR